MVENQTIGDERDDKQDIDQGENSHLFTKYILDLMVKDTSNFNDQIDPTVQTLVFDTMIETLSKDSPFSFIYKEFNVMKAVTDLDVQSKVVKSCKDSNDLFIDFTLGCLIPYGLQTAKDLTVIEEILDNQQFEFKLSGLFSICSLELEDSKSLGIVYKLTPYLLKKCK